MFAVVAGSILCFAFTSHSYPVSGIVASSVDIITSATKTNSGAGAGAGTGGKAGSAANQNNQNDTTEYYYLVTHIDGSQEYVAMVQASATNQKDEMMKEYRDELAKYSELKKQWIACFGSKPFVLDRPGMPQIDKRGKYPTTDRYRTQAEEKHNAELEQYAVCVLLDKDGTKTAEIIRKDKVAAKKNELEKQFIEAAMAEAAKRKHDPEAAKAPFPFKRPDVTSVPMGDKKFMPKELAEKFLAKVQQKLEKQAAAQTEPAGAAAAK